MNDSWWITATLAYTVVLLVGGAWLMARQRKFGSSGFWMAGLLVLQTVALGIKGMEMGGCPIYGLGETFFFMGWSLNAFYLLLGRSYRMSAIGLFTLPGILLCVLLSLIFHHEIHAPTGIRGNQWVTWHVGLAMLAYGAFGLSAVAGWVFLIQNELLKKHRLSGISKILPPVRLLQSCMVRLIASGFVLIVCSQVFGYGAGIDISPEKWTVAGIVSFGYLALLLVVIARGLPGRWLAWASIALYVWSLLIFFVVK